MNIPTILVATPLLFAAACAVSGSTETTVHPLVAELDDLRVQQQVFRQQNTAPIEFDFPEDGRVTVREISLDGWPGAEYLRCRFHYQNRTTRPIVKAWVSLDVLDARHQVVSSQSVNCIVPVPIPLARGSYYSDELRTPTYGAHLEPGWSWRIRCIATPETEDEPLDPPVAPRTPRQSAPMQIKNRGQNDL
ncbi:MAG: hypothetical protein JNK78_05085 [Planctomycetes bacterium]|nr:hypothetical protein [Planctomycetota bacterium]